MREAASRLARRELFKLGCFLRLLSSGLPAFALLPFACGYGPAFTYADLARLGLRPLCEANSQDAVFIVRFDVVRINRRRQCEGSLKAPVLSFDAAKIPSFFFLLQLAFAADGKNIPVHFDGQIVLVYARDFHLYCETVFVLVHIDRRSERRHGHRALPAFSPVAPQVAKQPVHAVLHGAQLREWIPTS